MLTISYGFLFVRQLRSSSPVPSLRDYYYFYVFVLYDLVACFEVYVGEFAFVLRAQTINAC